MSMPGLSSRGISYSNDFIDRVKSKFPNNAELHTLLDKGSGWAIGKAIESDVALHAAWGKIINDPAARGKPTFFAV